VKMRGKALVGEDIENLGNLCPTRRGSITANMNCGQPKRVQELSVRVTRQLQVRIKKGPHEHLECAGGNGRGGQSGDDLFSSKPGGGGKPSPKTFQGDAGVKMELGFKDTSIEMNREHLHVP